jgi:hypothetical protein
MFCVQQHFHITHTHRIHSDCSTQYHPVSAMVWKTQVPTNAHTRNVIRRDTDIEWQMIYVPTACTCTRLSIVPKQQMITREGSMVPKGILTILTHK